MYALFLAVLIMLASLFYLCKLIWEVGVYTKIYKITATTRNLIIFSKVFFLIFEKLTIYYIEHNGRL